MHSRQAFFLLLAGSVVVHTGALAWVHIRAGGIDAYAFNSLDCGEYYALAKNIVRHGAFSQNEAAPFSPDTWRTPGYPMLLAAGMLLVGDSPTALILLQHLAAMAAVLLLFRLLLRYFSPGRATIAALIFLMEPYHLFYSFWLLSTTVFTLVLILSWWLWERVREGTALWHSIALGFSLGFLVLIWPGAILVPVFVLGGLVACRWRESTSPPRPIATSSHGSKLALALTAIACAAPPLAWMTRNKFVAGHFSLSHQSGIVLAYFKATEVELWRQGRTADRYIETSMNPAHRTAPHTVWDAIDDQLCERLFDNGPQPPSSPRGDLGVDCSQLKWPNLAQGNKTTFDSFAVSRELAYIGRSMLLDAPGSAAVCGGVRILENMTFPLGLAIRPAEGTHVNRIKAAILGVGYTLLAVAAGVGAFRARRNWPGLYFPIACVIALALTTAPQIDPRFRVPLIPLLAFLALFPAHRAES